MRLQALSNSLNAGALSKIQAAIEDETLIDDFKPHMLHHQHEPCRELQTWSVRLDLNAEAQASLLSARSNRAGQQAATRCARS